MPMVPQEDVVTALVAMLEATLPHPVGDGQPPDGDPPYYIVYVLPGLGYTGPPLSAPDEDARMVVQVTSVGSRRDQAMRLASLARDAMLGRDGSGSFQTSIAGGTFVVVGRWPDGGSAEVDYEGNPPNRLFTARDRYGLHVSPSS